MLGAVYLTSPVFAQAMTIFFAIIAVAINFITLGTPVNRSLKFNPDESENVERALAVTQEIELVGLFADALYLDIGLERPPLMAALTRLLPKLTAADDYLLNARQRKNLYDALSYGLKSETYRDDERLRGCKFADYCISILEALSKIGGKDALRSIEKLAKMNAPSAQQARVRDAARHYLPLIQQRAQEDKDSAILLRASHAGTPQNQLLRPAAPTANETDAQQLLRATTSEESL